MSGRRHGIWPRVPGGPRLRVRLPERVMGQQRLRVGRMDAHGAAYDAPGDRFPRYRCADRLDVHLSRQGTAALRRYQRERVVLVLRRRELDPHLSDRVLRATMAVSEPLPARQHWDGAGLAMLVGAFLAGPSAWGLNLLLNYSLVKPACAAGSVFVLTAVSVAAILMTIAGGFVSWRCWLGLRESGTTEGGRVVDRSYFLAVTGMVLNAFF